MSTRRAGTKPLREFVTPERFNRGSSPNIPSGFPLKACGNDGLQEDASFTQKAKGTSTHLDWITV